MCVVVLASMFSMGMSHSSPARTAARVLHAARESAEPSRADQSRYVDGRARARCAHARAAARARAQSSDSSDSSDHTRHMRSSDSSDSNYM